MHRSRRLGRSRLVGLAAVLLVSVTACAGGSQEGTDPPDGVELARDQEQACAEADLPGLFSRSASEMDAKAAKDNQNLLDRYPGTVFRVGATRCEDEGEWVLAVRAHESMPDTDAHSGALMHNAGGLADRARYRGRARTVATR